MNNCSGKDRGGANLPAVTGETIVRLPTAVLLSPVVLQLEQLFGTAPDKKKRGNDSSPF